MVKSHVAALDIWTGLCLLWRSLHKFDGPLLHRVLGSAFSLRRISNFGISLNDQELPVRGEKLLQIYQSKCCHKLCCRCSMHHSLDNLNDWWIHKRGHSEFTKFSRSNKDQWKQQNRSWSHQHFEPTKMT